MKIAIIADSLDNQNAGVYQYTRSLINALAKKENRQHEYILIRQVKEPNLPFQQIILKNIKLPIGYASLRLFFVIPFILRKHKVDAVFEPAHFGPFNLPNRIKRITMIHDLTPILFPNYHNWHSQFLQKLFLPRILKKTNLILSNSGNTSKDILKYQKLNPNKVKTILLGRDEYYQKLKKIKNPFKSPYFLAVGTIEPRKNLILLLEAFELFKSKNKNDIQLLIAGGNGWKTEIFYENLDQHPFKNDIQLLGFVSKSELRNLYNHAIALIYPSLYEGFGFPILEAMSCGTNVITYNHSSLPEVGGDKAIYFEEPVAKKITYLMNQLNQKEIGFSSEELIKQSLKFSWKNYVNKFEAIIKDSYLIK